MSGGKPVSVIIPKATTKALSSMKELRPVRADAELKRPLGLSAAQAAVGVPIRYWLVGSTSILS
jgi:hypothetical protein